MGFGGNGMSEKKYYVALKLLDVDDETIYLTVWTEEGVSDEPYFYPAKSEHTHKQAKNIFTKSELTEIMDGALYKQTDSLPFEWLYSFESLKEKLGWEFNETIDKWEYTNPIIELVPVEDK